MICLARLAGSLVFLTGVLGQPVRAAEMPAGPWWVVLGSSPAPDSTGVTFPTAWRAGKAARRCGVDAMSDFSAKFEGFAPDLYVSAAGGYRTRDEAAAVLARVRPCVPGAYVKRGSYAGE
jgi:hypothetical protein